MSNPAPEARGGALIVAADREDRRVLFDALDAQAFEEIYSARDIEQARGFLVPDLDIDLVLLEFGEDPAEALTFCDELRKHARHDLPVIGILGSRGGSWRDGRLPAGLIEWIARPVKPDDALARIKVALAARSAGTVRSQHATGGERYQFAFDGSLDELAIVDPASGRILEVNATFVQRSGYPRAQILAGRIDGFDLVLTAERREEIARKLERDGSVHVRARKPRADGGSYPVDLHVRLAVQEGRVVHFYLFREIEELSRHQEALVALLRMAQGGSHDPAETTLRCLVDWLALRMKRGISARKSLPSAERKL